VSFGLFFGLFFRVSLGLFLALGAVAPVVAGCQDGALGSRDAADGSGGAVLSSGSGGGDGGTSCKADPSVCQALEDAQRDAGPPDPACATLADPYVAALTAGPGCGVVSAALIAGNRGGVPTGKVSATFTFTSSGQSTVTTMPVSDSIAPGGLALVQLFGVRAGTLQVGLDAADGSDCVAANDVASIPIVVGLCAPP